jgi:hypothetical protein
VIYLGHPQVVLQSRTSKFSDLMVEWKIMSTSLLVSNIGMPLDRRGFPDGYFRIRAAGSKHYWALHGGDSSKDGNMICLYDRSDGSQNKARVRRLTMFYIT